MLTLKPSAHRYRAVCTGPADAPTGAALIVDDKLKIYRFSYDLQAKVLQVWLEFGCMLDGTWSESTETVSVTFDTARGRTNPLHDRTWAYFRQLMAENGGELSLAMIERVIVERELLVGLLA